MSQQERHHREPRLRKRLSVEFGEGYPLPHSGFTSNVSPRGLRIVSTNLHKRGTQLVLEVRLPDGGVSRLHGRVAWARQGTTALGIPNAMGVHVVSGDEGWFRLVADVARIDLGAPPPDATPGRGIARTGPIVPEVPAARSEPPPPRPPPARVDPPPPTPKAVSRPPPPRPKEEPKRAPPTLEELRAKPQVERLPRFNDRLKVFFGTSPRMELSGVTIDVGIGGIAIETLSLRPVGTKLFVEVELPDGSLVGAQGEVVRTRTFELLQRQPNSMGVRFTESDEAWQAYIEERARQS